MTPSDVILIALALSFCLNSQGQFRYVLSTGMEDEIREAFVAEKLREFTKVGSVFAKQLSELGVSPFHKGGPKSPVCEVIVIDILCQWILMCIERN